MFNTKINSITKYVVWPGTRQKLPYLKSEHIKPIIKYPERTWCQFEIISGREKIISKLLEDNNIPSYYPQARFFCKQQQQSKHTGRSIFPGYLFAAVKDQKECDWLTDHILVKKTHYSQTPKLQEKLLAELKFMVIVERINLHFKFQKTTKYPIFDPANCTKIVECNGLSEILIIDNQNILNLYCYFQTVGQILTFSITNNDFRALMLSGFFKC